MEESNRNVEVNRKDGQAATESENFAQPPVKMRRAVA